MLDERLQPLRPLGRSVFKEIPQRMGFPRGDHSREATLFDRRGIEQLGVAHTIGEHDAIAVSIEAVILELLVGLRPLRTRLQRAIGQQSVHESVPHGGELDEAALPRRRRT